MKLLTFGNADASERLSRALPWSIPPEICGECLGPGAATRNIIWPAFYWHEFRVCTLFIDRLASLCYIPLLRSFNDIAQW